jgi:O-acetylserine/cysteine efflux transporter
MKQTASTAFTTLSKRDLGCALAVVLIWGANFVAMKLALRDFTAFQLGAARYVAAVLPLVLFIRPPKLHWKWCVMFGLSQGVGQFGLLFIGLHVGMTAALASVLLQAQVFFTAILGFFLLRERIGTSLRIGLALAALGLFCFIMNFTGPAATGASVTTPLGFVLSLGAASMWAVSNIVTRRAQQSAADFDPLSFLVWSSLMPILPFFGLSMLFDAPQAGVNWANARWSSWVAVLYLGWCATILAYGMWTTLIKKHGVNRVAPFSLGVPVVGLSAGVIVLGEVITGWQWAGVALLVCALASVILSGLPGRKSAPAANR